MVAGVAQITVVKGAPYLKGCLRTLRQQGLIKKYDRLKEADNQHGLGKTGRLLPIQLVKPSIEAFAGEFSQAAEHAGSCFETRHIQVARRCRRQRQAQPTCRLPFRHQSPG